MLRERSEKTEVIEFKNSAGTQQTHTRARYSRISMVFVWVFFNAFKVYFVLMMKKLKEIFTHTIASASSLER